MHPNMWFLGAHPTIQPGISAGRTSALEKVTTRWIVASHEGADVNEAASPVESCFVVWKHVYNDEIYDRLGGYCFEPDQCPSALFGFDQIKTGVQVEIIVFWSLNQAPSKRREFPFMWQRAKEHGSIYRNFLHQPASSVSLENLTPGRSWIMQDKKPHKLRVEELGTSQGPIHFKEAIATAKRYSGRGELSSVASTKCEVMMTTAVEGKVILNTQERIGEPSIFHDTTKDVLKFDFITGMQALKLQLPSRTATGLNPTASSSSTGLQTPGQPPQTRERSKNPLIQFGRSIFGYK